MGKKPTLETRWGNPNKTWEPLITAPTNTVSDLTLTSRVIEQDFWSLQQHEYYYGAVNGSYANDVYCYMKVNWNGPEIKFPRLAPGPPSSDIKIQSFFSAQMMKTTADIDLLAGSKSYTPRQPPPEEANAYVPRFKAIGKHVLRLLKAAAGLHVPIGNAASMVMAAGQSLNLVSEFQAVKQGFEYRLKVSNVGRTPLSIEIPGIHIGDEDVSLELGAGQEKQFQSISSDLPSEKKVVVQVSDVCEFPAYLLVSEEMARIREKTKVGRVTSKKKPELARAT
jgi:hypothetical protein